MIPIKSLTNTKLPELTFEALRAMFVKTLIVDKEHDAIAIADRIRIENWDLVLVQDRSGRIIGYIEPRWLLTQINNARNESFCTLSDALRHLAQDPKEQQRNFHHETYTQVRPKMGYCEQGKHYTSTLPCTVHGK